MGCFAQRVQSSIRRAASDEISALGNALCERSADTRHVQRRRRVDDHDVRSWAVINTAQNRFDDAGVVSRVAAFEGLDRNPR